MTHLGSLQCVQALRPPLPPPPRFSWLNHQTAKGSWGASHPCKETSVMCTKPGIGGRGGGRRNGPKGMGLGPPSLHFFCSVIDPSLVIVQGRQAWPSHKSPPLVGSSSGVKEPVQSAARRVAAEIHQVHGHPPQPLQSWRPTVFLGSSLGFPASLSHSHKSPSISLPRSCI